MADLKTAKEIIEICAVADGPPVCLVGGSGIGKSDMVKSFRDSGVPVIDFRLSQVPPEDILGIPKATGTGQFTYEAPWWWPREPAPEVEITVGGVVIKRRLGILFFDEVNRAKGDRQQAIFQLLTDRKIGPRELPEGWHVVSAINPANAEYHVHDLERAMRGRFMFVPVEFDTTSWLEWADKVGYIPTFVKRMVSERGLVVEQIDINEYPVVQPRTLAWLSKIVEAIGTQHRLLRICATGLLGTEMSSVFMQYASDDKDKPISFKDWQKMTDEEVVAKATELNTLGRVDLANATVDNIVAGIEKLEKSNKKKTDVGALTEARKLVAFMTNFNRDLLTTRISDIVKVSAIRHVVSTSPEFKKTWDEMFDVIVKAEMPNTK